jgi:hypothetical protein
MVGTHSITASYAGNASYDVSTSGALSQVVIPATSTATVTVNNSATYDGFAHAATVIVSGTNTVGSVTSILTGGATTQTAAGTYAVTATFVPANTNYTTLTGLSAGNFTISNALGTAFSNLSSVTNSYGTTNIFLTGTISATGPVYPAIGELVSATINGDITVSGTVTNGTGGFFINTNSLSLGTNGVAGSPYSITYNYAGNLAAASDASTSLMITNALLTITANDDSKTYDGNAYDTNNGVTYLGFVNGETNTVLTGSLTYGGTSQGATNAGSYTIVPSGLTSTNYAINYSNGTLTVNPATPTITAVSSENPAGYHESITFTATLPADATGSVLFSALGGAVSTNAVATGIATSLSITNLPRGTNVITVAYLGDGNYVGNTNTLNQVVTNHPPVANGAIYTRNGAVNAFRVSVSDLLTNATDMDGDTLSLASVGATTNGALLLVSGGFLEYFNTNAVADQFAYTVTDGYGGTNSAIVTITVSSTSLFGQSTVASVSGGSATLNFAGIPGYSYSVSRSTNLVDWTSIWTTNAPSGGLFQFIDTSAPTTEAYYQLQYNP